MPVDREVSTTVFQHDDDYKELNEQAHPRVPPRLSAPALNWHVAIWNPSVEEGGTSVAKADFQAWAHQAAELLASILSREVNRVVSINGVPVELVGDRLMTVEQKKHHASARPHEIDILGFPVRYADKAYRVESLEDFWKRASSGTNPFKIQLFGCSFFWSGQLVKLSCELHREYLTLTVWLPAYRARGYVGDQGLCDGSIAHNLREYFAALLRYVYVDDPQLGDDEKANKAEKRPSEDDIARWLSLRTPVPRFTPHLISTYFYRDIWRIFSDAQLKPFFDERHTDPDKNILLGKLKTFADFRSIILPSDFPSSGRDRLPGDDSKIDHKRHFKQSVATRITGRLGEFLEVDSGVRAELSGSLFLKQRVIYLSSYGSAATSSHPGPGRSARYVMIAHPGSRWQLGRLVERLNIVGTLRLAAIRNLRGLNQVSEQIRSVGRRLDKFQRDWPDDLEPKTGEYNEINRQFARIGSSDVINGGLNYRIERSRYYVDSFKRILPGLRVSRIEGYQPYDEFVARRYASTWDRISRLGYRHGRLQQRLDFLANKVTTSQQLVQSRQQTMQTLEQVDQTKEQLKQTREQVAQTKEQLKQTGELARQTEILRQQGVSQVEQTAAMRRQSDDQTALLRTAEAVGAFPIAYYGGANIGGLVEAANSALLHTIAAMGMTSIEPLATVLSLSFGEHGFAMAPFVAAGYLVWLHTRVEHRRRAVLRDADGLTDEGGATDQDANALAERERATKLRKIQWEKGRIVIIGVGLLVVGVIATWVTTIEHHRLVQRQEVESRDRAAITARILSTYRSGKLSKEPPPNDQATPKPGAKH